MYFSVHWRVWLSSFFRSLLLLQDCKDTILLSECGLIWEYIRSLLGEVQQVFGGLFTQYFLTHFWTCCTSGLLQFNGSHLGSCPWGISWAQTDVFHSTTLIIWIMKARSCFFNPLNRTESSLCFWVCGVCRTSLVTLSRHSSLAQIF